MPTFRRKSSGKLNIRKTAKLQNNRQKGGVSPANESAKSSKRKQPKPGSKAAQELAKQKKTSVAASKRVNDSTAAKTATIVHTEPMSLRQQMDAWNSWVSQKKTSRIASKPLLPSGASAPPNPLLSQTSINDLPQELIDEILIHISDLSKNGGTLQDFIKLFNSGLLPLDTIQYTLKQFIKTTKFVILQDTNPVFYETILQIANDKGLVPQQVYNLCLIMQILKANHLDNIPFTYEQLLKLSGTEKNNSLIERIATICGKLYNKPLGAIKQNYTDDGLIFIRDYMLYICKMTDNVYREYLFKVVKSKHNEVCDFFDFIKNKYKDISFHSRKIPKKITNLETDTFIIQRNFEKNLSELTRQYNGCLTQNIKPVKEPSKSRHKFFPPDMN